MLSFTSTDSLSCTDFRNVLFLPTHIDFVGILQQKDPNSACKNHFVIEPTVKGHLSVLGAQCEGRQLPIKLCEEQNCGYLKLWQSPRTES